VAKVGKDERHFKILHDSDIIDHEGLAKILHNWLKEDDSDGEFTLLYRGSRDGLSGPAFHSKCNNKGCTLTIIETTCGRVIGGYSNTSWSASGGSWKNADKAFLFALSGICSSSPCKMKLKHADDERAIYKYSDFGPTFGASNDICVRNGSQVHLYPEIFLPPRATH
jgi:hypothetical protein